MMMKLIILLIGLMVSLGVHAQVYKWVDKDGNVHFSDQPPVEEEALAEEVDVSASELSAQQQRAAEIRHQQQLKKASEQRDTRAKNADEEKRQRIESHNQAVRNSQACAQAQSRLDFLIGAGRIYTTNEEGERQYMDNPTRDAQIEKIRQLVKQNC
jgi:ABC-type multidrug transport system fused ATPase/permease subunit